MKTLSGKTLEEIAIERLKMFEPPEGFWVAYSGGKDSDVILNLTRRSGCKYDAHHSLTTADPPEVVRHVKEQADVEIHRPKRTMWESIKYHKCPPRRGMAYCCAEQKESGGTDRLIVTGIRWGESSMRSKRKMVEHCYRDKSKRYLHVIIDWTTTDVWEYLRGRNIKYCSLYDEGFTRIGCVLCPKIRDVELQMQRWPKLCRAWERAVKATFNPDKVGFANAEEYWQWWLNRDAKAKTSDTDRWLFR